MSEPPKTRERAVRTVVIALVAAWLGWGFDVFDAHLFNYMAKPVLVTLLEKPSEPEVNAWLARLTALFLVGWAAGGILFGRITDRIGRARTMLLTMILYGGGTAACALCHSLTGFVLCRVVASLGVGGEWAAGAALVAEVAPDRWRPLTGALLYTASPLGQLLTTKVRHHIVDANPFGLAPGDTWRAAFLCGLLPAVLAFALRALVSEPERWKEHRAEPASLAELFAPALLRRTLTGLALSTVALLGAWGILGFVPKVVEEWGTLAGLTKEALSALVDRGNVTFVLGGTAGTLATVPAAMILGRRGALALYFAGALGAARLVLGSGLELEPRLSALFLLGFFAHGIFGIFPFYLPELFPTRIRGTGAGFCYSTGRLASAVGVFFMGDLQKVHGLVPTMLAVSWVYLLGIVLLPAALETKDEKL